MTDKIIDELSFKLLVSHIHLISSGLKDVKTLLIQLTEENKTLHRRLSILESKQ